MKYFLFQHELFGFWDIKFKRNLTLSRFFQVETLGSRYDWEGENEKYGEINSPFNRASDDSDSDLEDRPVMKAFLTEKLRLRAMTEELKEQPMGLEVLVRHRAIAEYEARKRPDFNKEAFDAMYPPYIFDKNHNKIQVKVTVGYL